MSDCPSKETLERLLAEALTEQERTRIEGHVEHCAKCQATLNTLTRGALGLASQMGKHSLELTIEGYTPQTEAFFDGLKKMTSASRSGEPDGSTNPNESGLRPPEVDGYQILGVLGHGATGVVYRARHLKLNRLVALKVIVAGPHLSEDVRHRFQTEAQAIARLKHPHIVQVYDVGEYAECPFLSLELIEGGNLAEWLAGKPRAALEAAQIMATLAKTVEFAHRQGVVHRDLKPANVLLSIVPERPKKRELKITDFGIAKVLPQAGISEVQMTHTGEILGTPAYMAPEQARGNAGEITAATDIYSLGAMLYELLTGRPPFQGATPLDTLMQAASQEPVSVSLLVPRVPKDLDTICIKCLQKDPAKRYSTAGELADDLERFLKNEPIRARPISIPERATRWVRRNSVAASALGVIAFLLLLLLTGSLAASAYFRALERQQHILAQEKSDLADQKETERQKAVKAEHRESQLRQKAEDQGQELRRNAYFDQMNLACHAAQSPSGIGRVCEYLSPWAQSQPDLRAWEWYYLNSLCHRDLLTIHGISGMMGAALSPNGRLLACGGSQGFINVWEIGDGQKIQSLAGHSGEVYTVAWSPDGQRLASASWDGSIKVWNVSTGQELLTFRGHLPNAYSVAWSPDGTRLASCGIDQTAKIWNAQTGAVQFTLRNHNGTVLDVAWSPDGKRLATAGADRTIRIWDTLSGDTIRQLLGHANFVNRVVWNHDGTRLASASNDQTVKIWDPASGAELVTLRGHALGVSAVAWSPDGTRLASSSDDQTIKVWLAKEGTELFTLRGHLQPVTSVEWSPDGTRLTSSSFDYSLKIWNADIGPEVPLLAGHAGPIRSLAWSPDSQHLVSAGADHTLRLWTPSDGPSATPLLGHTDWVNTAVWSPDGTRIASAGYDKTIRFWNPSTAQLLATLPLDGEPIQSIAFSPDGQRLASGGLDHTVRIWDPTNGHELQRLQGETDAVYAVAWSPDGQQLAGAGQDRLLRVWDPSTGQQTMILRGHAGRIHCIAWSPDGTRIASASDDQTIKIWNAHTGQLIFTLRGHTTRVKAIAWNADGTRLASGSEDQTVKLWDPQTGREALSLECPGCLVQAIAWSPDGLRLAAAGEGAGIRVFDASAGYLFEQAAAYLPVVDRRLNANPNNLADWQLHAEIEARRGDWDHAASDLQHVFPSHPQQPWHAIGYWVIGPYPDSLSGTYPPEKGTLPDQPLLLDQNADSAPTLNWRSVPLYSYGFINFSALYNYAEHISAYAMERVYALKACDVAVLIGSDDQHRLWLNGHLIHECMTGGNAIPDDQAVLAKLQPGWNTILVRVINQTGDHELYMRLSALPADLQRAQQESLNK